MRINVHLVMPGLVPGIHVLWPSFHDVQSHIVDAPLGAGPESLTADRGYGFRAHAAHAPE
jgi:hypothetical protein